MTRAVAPASRAGRRFAWALGLALGLFACAHAAPPVRPVDRPAAPRWASLFSPAPEATILLRPRSLLRNDAYGAVMRRAFELGQEEHRLVAAAGLLEAAKDADEVLIGVRRARVDARANDLVVVVRGVDAAVDPAHLTDARGRPSWVAAPAQPAPDTRELWPASSDDTNESTPGGAQDVSLFELPARTWVIAAGAYRARARDVFARAGGPAASGSTAGAMGEPDALAELKVQGPSLVARLKALQPPSLLSPIGHELSALVVDIPVEGEALIVATLSYGDTRAVAPAEATVRAALGAIASASARGDGEKLEWLRGATVSSSRCCVEVSVPLHKGAPPPPSPPASVERGG